MGSFDDIASLLRDSFADRRLTRAERDEFERLFHASVPDQNARDRILALAFALFREGLSERDDREASEWLKRVVRATLPRPEAKEPENDPLAEGADVAEAWFSERHDCARRICQLFDKARSSVDICVFTITHDAVTDAIERAERRGVEIRLVSDDLKATDTGSDIDRLRRAGVAVRTDRSPHHMHHKFAIFDRRLLLTGSFNWTRGAAMNNAENFVLLSDARLIEQFQTEFELLWENWK